MKTARAFFTAVNEERLAIACSAPLLTSIQASCFQVAPHYSVGLAQRAPRNPGGAGVIVTEVRKKCHLWQELYPCGRTRKKTNISVITAVPPAFNSYSQVLG